MPSILYVEDELDYQWLAQRIFQKARFKCKTVDTGKAALAELAQERPDLLILDVNLPDTDGYQLCQRIRQNPEWKSIPILMLTVRRRAEEWLQGFSCGATDYLPKPIYPPELIDRVQACLRRPSVAHPSSGEFQLVQAGVHGNRKAIAVLVQQHHQRLIDMLRGCGRTQAEAEDIVSAAWAKAYQRLDQFHGRSAFYTWMHRISMNELRKIYRRDRSVVFDRLSGGEETTWGKRVLSSDRVEDRLSQAVLHAQLRQAVARIPRPYRTLLRWHFFHDLSYDVIARRLKSPKGTVMSRLFTAKELLRTSWKRLTRELPL